MKVVTSVTMFRTAEGMRLSVTYSEIDDAGKIIKQNVRVNRIVLDETELTNITAVEAFAQKIVDGE